MRFNKWKWFRLTNQNGLGLINKNWYGLTNEKWYSLTMKTYEKQMNSCAQPTHLPTHPSPPSLLLKTDNNTSTVTFCRQSPQATTHTKSSKNKRTSPQKQAQIPVCLILGIIQHSAAISALWQFPSSHLYITCKLHVSRKIRPIFTINHFLASFL